MRTYAGSQREWRVTPAGVAAAAAIGAVVAWGVKALVIWNAGGLDKSALESPLFVVGLVALVVALAALGVAVTEDRPAWRRALAGVAAVVVGVVASVLIQNVVVSALLPDSTGWVREEAGLWVSSVLISALAIGWFARPGRRSAGENRTS